MTIKIGYAEGTCPNCGKTLRRRRPADLAKMIRVFELRGHSPARVPSLLSPIYPSVFESLSSQVVPLLSKGGHIEDEHNIFQRLSSRPQNPSAYLLSEGIAQRIQQFWNTLYHIPLNKILVAYLGDVLASVHKPFLHPRNLLFVLKSHNPKPSSRSKLVQLLHRIWIFLQSYPFSRLYGNKNLRQLDLQYNSRNLGLPTPQITLLAYQLVCYKLFGEGRND